MTDECINCEDKKFCFDRRAGCLECKLKYCQQELIKDPLKEKWADCPVRGQALFLKRLQRVMFYCWKQSEKKYNEKPTSIRFWREMLNLFGREMYKKYAELYLSPLITFASKEHADYGFSPIDFSIVRFERQFQDRVEVMNFWTTLNVVYDLGNYLMDLESE